MFDQVNARTSRIGELEISLSDIIRTVLDGRWIILVCVSVVVFLSLVGALITAQYKSEGLYQFGGPIPLGSKQGTGIAYGDYKRFAVSFQTPERFNQYVAGLQLENAAGVASLQKLFASRGGIEKRIEPLHSFTQADAKTLLAPKDTSNNILGLRINLHSPKPEVAQQMVSLLGRYVMDSIIYDAYADKLLSDLNNHTARGTEIDNELISNQEHILELQRKEDVLQKIVKRYPNVADPKAQQVISVNEESVRYLPSVTQLVGVELQLADISESSRKLQREKRQLELRKQFYSQLLKLHRNLQSGEVFLTSMPLTLHDMFKDMDKSDDAVAEVFNSLKIEIQQAENLYLESSRFVAGPTLPLHSSVRLVLVAAVAAFVGLFISLIIVLGRRWWKDVNANLSSD